MSLQQLICIDLRLGLLYNITILGGIMAENLLESFDEYDRVPCSTVNEAVLDASAKKEAENKKITECKKLISKVEKMVNSRLVKIGVTSKVKINETFSCGNESLFKTKTDFSKERGVVSGININLNINANKLKDPGFEFCVKLSTLLYNKILSSVPLNKTEALQENLQKSNEEPDKKPELKNAVRHDNELAQAEVAKWFLKNYIKDYLKTNFSEKFASNEELNLITELLTTDMIQNMTPVEIQRLPNALFSGFNKYDDLIARKSKNYLPSDFLYKMRTEKIREKATQFAADQNADYSNAEAISYEQQFAALSETFAGKTDKVKEALAGGFSNDNEQLREFCQKYADSFMASNKLNSIKVTFVTIGTCRFSDRGDTQEIKINLSSPELAGGNISELLMTMSHELTHAVDSSINKINGKFNESGGGLLNNMSEDISECDEPKAEPLLKSVQSFCYQLNPNERHARIGELSAVKFMKELYASDPEMQQQISESVEKYKAYQETTIRCAQILPDKIAEFKANLDKLNLPKSSKAYKMISERIDYLNSILEDMDYSPEQNSIEDMKKLNQANSEKNLQEIENVLQDPEKGM